MSFLKVGLGISTKPEAGAAVAQAVEEARRGLGADTPALAILTATVDFPAKEVFTALKKALPGVPVHGITTSLGVLGSGGIAGAGAGAVGLMLLRGVDGVSLAVGSAVLEKDGKAAGRKAAQAVLARAGGAKPALLLFNASPGLEEDVLAGVAEVLPGVPVHGGSAADNAIAGEWSVFTEEGPIPSGVSLAAVMGSVKVGTAFVAPYRDTGKTVTVTSGEGRTVVQLDGKPAAQVLNAVLDGALALQLKDGGNILAQTALRPVATRHATSHYLTMHPAGVKKPGDGVDVFAQVKVGDVLHLMEASVEDLTGALATLVDHALKAGDLDAGRVRAALLIYCAGCAGAVGPLLDQALKTHLGTRLPGVPVLGMCTFGEQGCVPGVGNLHQNLTLGLALLGS
jgi:hypothetical protein